MSLICTWNCAPFIRKLKAPEIVHKPEFGEDGKPTVVVKQPIFFENYG
jgi:hypothetical protein